MVAFAIWSVVAAIFVIVGVSAYKSKEPVGFFTFTKLPKIENVKAYNRAVGKLWFVFAFVLEILGVPFVFAEQNSPVFLFVIFGGIVLVIAIIVVYLQIEKKNKENK